MAVGKHINTKGLVNRLKNRHARPGFVPATGQRFNRSSRRSSSCESRKRIIESLNRKIQLLSPFPFPKSGQNWWPNAWPFRETRSARQSHCQQREKAKSVVSRCQRASGCCRRNKSSLRGKRRAVIVAIYIQIRWRSSRDRTTDRSPVIASSSTRDSSLKL